MSNKPTQEEMNRLSWHSRRGMLELDVLLVPFTTEVYPDLSPELRAVYTELLASEDADLFTWFMETEAAQDARFAEMVTMIVQYARSRIPAC